MSLYNDQITIIPRTMDQWNKLTEGAGVQLYGRFYNKSMKAVNNSDGQPVNYRYMMLFQGSVSVNEGDLVTVDKIKGEAVTKYTKMEVLAVLKTGTFSVHHTEVYA